MEVFRAMKTSGLKKKPLLLSVAIVLLGGLVRVAPLHA
jgi:hypothetical protein